MPSWTSRPGEPTLVRIPSTETRHPQTRRETAQTLTDLCDWNQELVSFESQERFDFAAKVNDGKSTTP